MVFHYWSPFDNLAEYTGVFYGLLIKATHRVIKSGLMNQKHFTCGSSGQSSSHSVSPSEQVHHVIISFRAESNVNAFKLS